MPQLETLSRYSFGVVRELGFLMAFRAIRDGSNRVLKIGRLADLTL